MVVGCTCLALLPVACHTAPGAPSRMSPGKPQTRTFEPLAERAEACWKARVAENWTAMFQYIAPEKRKEWSSEAFAAWSAKNEPFQVLNFEVRRVEEQGILGWVTVDYTSKIRQFAQSPARAATKVEKWSRSDGVWYLVPKEKLASIPAPPSKRDAAAEHRLRERFDDAWSARRRGDHDALYHMLDLDQRSQVSPALFDQGESVIDYLDAAVQWVEVIGDQGRVCVTYTFKLADPNMKKMRPQHKTIIEDWKLQQGQWNYVRK